MKAPEHDVLVFRKDGMFKVSEIVKKRFWLASEFTDRNGNRFVEGNIVVTRYGEDKFIVRFDGYSFYLSDKIGTYCGRLEEEDVWELEVDGHIAEEED